MNAIAVAVAVAVAVVVAVAVAVAVADISSTIVAAQALEGAAFVATRGAGEEGGGRDNQHYVGGGRGVTKGRVKGRWRGDDDVRVLALARCCRRRGEDVTINIGGR
jgi:hypothetical protein